MFARALVGFYRCAGPLGLAHLNMTWKLRRSLLPHLLCDKFQLEPVRSEGLRDQDLGWSVEPFRIGVAPSFGTATSSSGGKAFPDMHGLLTMPVVAEATESKRRRNYPK